MALLKVYYKDRYSKVIYPPSNLSETVMVSIEQLLKLYEAGIVQKIGKIHVLVKEV